MTYEADINENDLLNEHPNVLQKLLLDHTTHKNIFWATDSYTDLGDGFCFADEITIEHITGVHGRVIMPRSLKHKDVQTQRSKDMAEVFTPAWICNAQNNLVDEAWFGRTGVFNHEVEEDHSWIPSEGNIEFSDQEGKSWKDYVRDVRLEITCGEAPYIVSRYDAVSGELIKPLNRRIGLLDRKLRVVSENTTQSGDWLKWAKEALRAIYGYEWQGDNLLLARESVFYTFCDFYKEKFGMSVPVKSLEGMAYIISWNLWQMDGLRMVIPGSCDNVYLPSQDLFESTLEKQKCPGCLNATHTGHIGVKCRIKNWRYTGKDQNKQKPFFITLLNNR